MPSQLSDPSAVAAAMLRRWRTDPGAALGVAAGASVVHLACKAMASARGFICSTGPGEPWSPLCTATGSFAVAALIVFAAAAGGAMKARLVHA